jgi:hypothetical protein
MTQLCTGSEMNDCDWAAYAHNKKRRRSRGRAAVDSPLSYWETGPYENMWSPVLSNCDRGCIVCV